jgi:putative FmdB family regulatory protein
MPIYEYVCTACGKEFEVMQKFSDPPVTSHECSRTSRVERKLSLPSFHLQGGGWYASGYGAKPGAAAKGESGVKADAAAKPATAGDKGDASAKGAKSESAAKPAAAPKAAAATDK